MGYLEGINFGAAYGLFDSWRSAFSTSFRDFWKADRRVGEQERPTRGQRSCDATRVYDPVWNESLSVGRHPTRSSMPYFGGFRRFKELLQGSVGTGESHSDKILERNTGLNWQIGVLRLACDYGI
jgi:hypothetical protein